MTVKRAPGQGSWLSEIEDPEDNWVRIVWLSNGAYVDGMWGLTDSFTESVTIDSEGNRVEIITITGSDHGKVPAKTPLFINIHERGGALPMIPLYLATADKLQGSPDQIVRTLLDAWVGNTGAAVNDKQWILPKSISGDTAGFFYDWCRWDTISSGLRGETFAPSLLSPDRAGSTLWDTIQEYGNGILNEMWWDLVPYSASDNRLDRMRPGFIMRERPFPTIRSRERWDAIPSHTLELGDVKNRVLVSDGSSRCNYWEMIILTLSGSSFSTRAIVQQIGGFRVGQPGNVPIYDLDSIRKHGLRKHTDSTRYLPMNDRSASANTVAPWLQVAVTWQRIIHDWFVTAPKQLTGTIETTYLRPEIRIGTRLKERRFDGSTWEYYVEGVSHHYAYPSEGSTTLTVTRGQPETANYLQQQYEKYAGLDITTLGSDEVATVTDPVTEALQGAESGSGNTPSNVSNGDALAMEASSSSTAFIDSQSGLVTPPSTFEDAPITDADFQAPLYQPFDDGTQTNPEQPIRASEVRPRTGRPRRRRRHGRGM